MLAPMEALPGFAALPTDSFSSPSDGLGSHDHRGLQQLHKSELTILDKRLVCKGGAWTHLGRKLLLPFPTSRRGE